jgi:hypothetical protein
MIWGSSVIFEEMSLRINADVDLQRQQVNDDATLMLMFAGRFSAQML